MTTPLNEGAVPAAAPADLVALRTRINVHLLWRDACREWSDAVGGPNEYEIFADKLLRAALATSAPLPVEAGEPIDMLLYCPNCGMQHIDAPDRLQDIVHAGSGTVVDQLWTNPPHKSHLCHGCGCIWRPADVPTNGVAELKTQGKADTWPVPHNEEVRATSPSTLKNDGGQR
jgi:hypothetical protein